MDSCVLLQMGHRVEWLLAINTISLIGARSFSQTMRWPWLKGTLYIGRSTMADLLRAEYSVINTLCSKSAGGVAVSVKNGAPLSSNAAHNPFSDLIRAPANASYGALDAAKTRGPNFFCSSRFIFSALALLSYAHAQASTSATWCAWYDATNNFPKGCKTMRCGTLRMLACCMCRTAIQILR